MSSYHFLQQVESLPVWEYSTSLNGALVCLGVFAGWRILKRTSSRLPPGPSGLPIVGNLFDLPTTFEWVTFGQWADKWGMSLSPSPIQSTSHDLLLTITPGPLVSASTFGTHFVVVNTYKRATAMLERKAVLYSTRPHVTMAVDLMGWGAASHFQPYGESFRAHRKMFHDELATGTGLKNWLNIEEERARNFVALCLKTPDQLTSLTFQ